MTYIIIVILILNMAAFLAILFNKKIEETIFLSISLKIIILFISGILFNLKVGFYLIIGISVLLFIFNIVSIIRKKNLLKSNILTIGLFIFIILFILLELSNNGRMLFSWDEFSHWGLVAKNMYYFNDFALGENSTLLFKTYLSGIALYQYFLLNVAGNFDESILYLGINILTLSMLIPIFKKFNNLKNIGIYLILFIILSIPTLFFGAVYSTLYMDALLGLTFAYLLYTYYINYNDVFLPFNYLNLICGFMMLIFIKHTGLIFALIAFLIILIDNLFFRQKFKLKINYIWHNSKKVFLAFLLSLFVKLIWILKLNSYNIVNPEGSFISKLLNFFPITDGDYRVDVFYNFSQALFFEKLTNSNYISLTYIVAIFCFFTLSYLLIKKIKTIKEQKAYNNLLILILIGAIGYAAFILLSYLTIFSEYEAVRLASYTRYLNTYLLGMFVLIIILLIEFYSYNKASLNNFLVITFLIISILINYETLTKTILFKPAINQTINFRNSYNEFIRITSDCVGENDILYFVSTNDSGLDYYVTKYDITPKKMNISGFGWSIGEKYDENDIWTLNITPEEWKNDLLSNYDFVYLYDIDEKFISRYGTLFKEKNNIDDNQLYKINNNANNKILEKIVHCSV